jgi:adenosylhomocysteine nucleosidase
MGHCAAQWSGSGPTAMPKVAIVAALGRELSGLTKGWPSVEREHQGRRFIFFERDDMVVVCGGIGGEAARRAAEAVIALYCPSLVESVGFAGALDSSLHIGDVLHPAVVIDAGDSSRIEIETGNRPGNRKGTLVTFMAVAGIDQKANLAKAYGAHAVDMEASAVAAAARAHGIRFDATKVISDEVNFEMPQMARFVTPQGQFRTTSFACFAALRPWLWLRVARLAINSHKAAKALGEHLERIRQELGRTPGENAEKITVPAEAVTTGSRNGGRE